jgi:hypothetical protein
MSESEEASIQADMAERKNLDEAVKRAAWRLIGATDHAITSGTIGTTAGQAVIRSLLDDLRAAQKAEREAWGAK